MQHQIVLLVQQVRASKVLEIWRTLKRLAHRIHVLQSLLSKSLSGPLEREDSGGLSASSALARQEQYAQDEMGGKRKNCRKKIKSNDPRHDLPIMARISKSPKILAAALSQSVFYFCSTPATSASLLASLVP
jgi:hypothetical protein